MSGIIERNWLSVGIILTFLGEILADSATITVQIPAGRIECFYHVATPNKPFEVEYQVISGGDLDINLAIRDPHGGIIITDQRKSDNLHKLNGDKPGEYQMCFDNSFSTFQPKLVFFEVFEDMQETHQSEFHSLGQAEKGIDLLGMKMEDLFQSLGRVHLSLEKSIKSQTVVKHFEAVDRIIGETNFEKVNFYSTIQTVVMVSVGIVQVVMVRSLFEERSKIGKVLRGGTSSRSYS
ncbi:putative Transmembrane emp24 domain-containing protein 1 [Hypsibius exemplaris]|uniref:Transmembrane emp24 domain-containing protein 1 n=1 Tax=Hypsibius exemplaris TaxID=2072580 RepID=A0A1W0WFB7_HYPEX|nr:putative Transmembrane emp24 domain-containing protein 1 [Hypsibius exemplaris]